MAMMLYVLFDAQRNHILEARWMTRRAARICNNMTHRHPAIWLLAGSV